MLKWLAMGCTAVALVGCNLTSDQTIPVTFEVDSDSSPDNGCAEVTKTIDLSQVKGFSEAQGHISKVELVSAEVTVVNANTSGTSVATQASGHLTASAGSAAPVEFGVYQPLALTTGNTQAVDVTNGDGSTLLTQVATTAPYEITVTAQGCADHYPAHFSLEVDLHANISLKLF